MRRRDFMFQSREDPHTISPRTCTLPFTLAASSLPFSHYYESRFREHFEDAVQLTNPAQGRSAYEPPEPEDDAESLRRLEAALARTSGSPEPPPASPEQYVQQFDSSGRPINPASRTAVREMIRAQNDVLATVGVCYGIAAGDKASHSREKPERDHLELVMRENEVGLFIGAADLGVLFLANWWLDGIRHRVQV